MNKWLIFIVILLMGSTIISCCKPATATPMGTVNAYLDAQVAQDPIAIVSYEIEVRYGETRAQRIETYKQEFEPIESISITNRILNVSFETDTLARVYGVIDVSQIMVGGETLSDTLSFSRYLTKVDGKWLIGEQPQQ